MIATVCVHMAEETALWDDPHWVHMYQWADIRNQIAPERTLDTNTAKSCSRQADTFVWLAIHKWLQNVCSLEGVQNLDVLHALWSQSAFFFERKDYCQTSGQPNSLHSFYTPRGFHLFINLAIQSIPSQRLWGRTMKISNIKKNYHLWHFCAFS